MADRHCWWCGFAAEVDTENPEPHNGLVRDTETSWICTDNDGCNQRALALSRRAGCSRLTAATREQRPAGG